MENNHNETNSIKSPTFVLKDLGSTIEVVITSGLQKNFYLYEVISILEEEGAEVVSAQVFTRGDMVFHTLHAKVIFFFFFKEFICYDSL